MGLFQKIKQKFHRDADNTNKLMSTENNKQQFGVPTDDEPRNRLMDTISNTQGAEYAAKERNPNETVTDKLEVDKNNLYNTLSNKSASEAAQGIDIAAQKEPPTNALLDTEPNVPVTDKSTNVVNDDTLNLNSDRVK